MLASGAAAYAIALLPLHATLVDGQYVPVGHDSFYHARRILDAINGDFYAFDPHIHAPEGRWVTWPWAYDWSMAQAARAIREVTGADAMAILAHIAPTWCFVNAALLLGIGATLGLNPWLLVLLGVSFASSPLTQELHAVGMLDHHFMEYTFVLASLLTALRWMLAPGSATRAFICGAVLGAAPAFQSGLFVLQIPVVLTLFVVWLRTGPLDRSSTRAFAAGLLTLSLVALLPSAPLWDGQFSFYTLSWFHAYVAVLSAVGALWLAWRAPNPREVVLLMGAGALALVPLAQNLLVGARFLDARIVAYDEIPEVISVGRSLSQNGLAGLARTYGLLVLLLPLSAAWSAWPLLRRNATAPRIAFAVFGLFGVTLLLLQYRLNNYGSFVLMLPPLLWCQERLARSPWLAAFPSLLIAGSAVAAWPALTSPVPLGQDFDYEMTRPIYPAFAAACEEHPGIVLADYSDGHYVTFHTNCSVIADTFIITREDEAKLLATRRLLSLRSRDIVEGYSYVNYIYVRRNDNFLQPLDPAAVAALNAGLRQELLFPGATLPPELKLVSELRLPEPLNGSDVLARVYRIDRPSPSNSRAP